MSMSHRHKQMTNGYGHTRGASPKSSQDYPHAWVLVKGADGRPLPGLGITVKTTGPVPTKDGVTTEPSTGYLAMNMPPDMDVIGEDSDNEVFGEHFDILVAISALDQIKAAAGAASAHWCDGALSQLPSPYTETASALGTAMRALARQDFHQFRYWIGFASGTAFRYGIPAFVYRHGRVPAFAKGDSDRRRARAIQAQILSESMLSHTPDAFGWSAVGRLAERIRSAAKNRDSESLSHVEQSIARNGWEAFHYDHWARETRSIGPGDCTHIGRVGLTPRWHLQEGESSKVLTMGLVATCTACGDERGYAPSSKSISKVTRHLGFELVEFPDRVSNLISEQFAAIFITQWQVSRRIISPFNGVAFLDLARDVVREAKDSIRASTKNPRTRGGNRFVDFVWSPLLRRRREASMAKLDSFPLFFGFAESIVRSAHFASVCDELNIRRTYRPAGRNATSNQLVKFVAPGTLAWQMVDAYSSRNIDQCLELLRRCYKFATWELSAFRRLT